MRTLRRNPLSVVVPISVILIVVASWAVDSQAAQLSFASPVVYPSTEYGSPFPSIVIVDLNGDGRPDLVVSTYSTDGTGLVSVLLGNGDGTFQSPATYSPGGYDAGSASIAIADVNADGHPDLVVGHECLSYDNCINGGLVSVMLGNGDGTFQAPVDYSTGGYDGFSVVVIADVNGDGHADLIVSNLCTLNDCSNGSVSVLLGNGDGTFLAPAFYSSGRAIATSVQAADLNGDGKPDLVVVNHTYAASVLLNNGNGTFQAPVDYDAGFVIPHSVSIGDLNADGIPDLVVTNGYFDDYPKGAASVLLGNGDGSFRTPVVYNSGGTIASPAAIADVNGDGYPDLVVANWYARGDPSEKGEVRVLLGKGDGTFQAPVIYSSGGFEANAVAIGDLNGDGRPDLVVANFWSITKPNYGSVGVLLNTLSFSTATALTSSVNPSFVGQPVTFTATVTSKRPVADGEVITFYDGATIVETASTTKGVASITTSSLPAKAQTIKAQYPGDAYHKASSGTMRQVVQKYPTTTSLTSTPNPSNYGQTVTFTATVTPSGPYAVSGKVKFWDGTTRIGTATLNAGVATLKKATLPVGTHSITAQYLGDGHNAASTSGVLNQVVQ